MKARANEGIFDSLAGKQAEEAVGITGASSGYVSARLATGLADVMHGVLHFGAPQWKDGVLQYKPGTRGLLEVLAKPAKKSVKKEGPTSDTVTMGGKEYRSRST